MNKLENVSNTFIVLTHDVNYIVFNYLDIRDLINLLSTCKSLKYDVEKYSLKIKKQIFKEFLNQYKCINCPSISYSISKICDNCVMDTCWECYNKTGNELLTPYNIVDDCIVLKCFYECKYKCSNCNLYYKKNYIKKDDEKYKIICIFCENKNIIL